MLPNTIDIRTAKKMEFLTHTFYYVRIGNFTVVQCVVNQSVYAEMTLSSRHLSYSDSFHDQNLERIAGLIRMLGVEPNPNFIFKSSPIENERYLIYRYMLSIFQIHKENTYMFENDSEFRRFCETNNFEYQSQSWFKRIYILDSEAESEAYLVKNSLIFQELYFPKDSNNNFMLPTLHDVCKLKSSYNFKLDFTEIYQILRSLNITCLYHFTDASNIQSIKKWGLLSQKEIKRRAISPKYSSTSQSRQADEDMGLDDYIRLGFVKSHPMMYTAMTVNGIHPRVIEINPLVALMPNVFFSDRNALRKGANIGGNAEDLRKVKFNVILGSTAYYDLPSAEEKSFYQAEIIVKQRIGPELFLNYNLL